MFCRSSRCINAQATHDSCISKPTEPRSSCHDREPFVRVNGFDSWLDPECGPPPGHYIGPRQYESMRMNDRARQEHFFGMSASIPCFDCRPVPSPSQYVQCSNRRHQPSRHRRAHGCRVSLYAPRVITRSVRLARLTLRVGRLKVPEL